MNGKTVTINGRAEELNVEPRRNLADYVREDLLLTGTHVGCEQGICGACTVVRDGRPVRSCLTPASSCEGSEVRTIESFDGDALMIRLREAFSQEHALQCGFCTPGMLITAQDIVRRFAGETISDKTIRYELSGNLCRCTGYVGIVRAIQKVLESYKTGPKPEAMICNTVETLNLPALDTIPLEQNANQESRTAATRSMADGNGRRIETQFELAYPAAAVWTILREELPAVVACLPGAELSSLNDDGTLEGFFNVKLGPVSARIKGEGKATFDDSSWQGQVSGQGSDSRSNSRAQGTLSFSLAELDASNSKMTVAISFEMSGALAQFSRGGLVEEIIGVLIEQFQTNFSRHLAGEAPVKQASLGIFQLAWMAFRRWLRR
ncbi:2Fe-2S iron-sulfur cluster-binding protein [Marinobacter sp. F3R08]|uniref:2Fe-2S iron-sulfur cluster-binding protein n=1 Tax=Marinobacter sp. F3R08 TaxID=2841559 RepID=UPI001C0819C5|nr:2Fe-2S iron-sulfur cluster-binding protein [Marinobacter sp. F3R08]MBU2955880.1 2Fe-2S iron-sulfur cluster binding domain-containing protein [Marinobacter sp. F3R08]